MRARATRFSFAFLAAMLTALCAGCLAQARQVQPFHYSGESIFTVGTDSPDVAIDEVAQTVLVSLKPGTAASIAKYSTSGASAPFEGLGGASSFAFPGSGGLNPSTHDLPIAIDNSGTASQGNFYVVAVDTSQVFGYAAGGTSLPGFPITTASRPCGVAVAPSGGVWVAYDGDGAYREYTPQGSPSGRVLAPGLPNGGCHIGFDSAGNFYLANGERLAKYDPNGKFVQEMAPGSPAVPPALPTTPPFAIDRDDNTMFALFGVDEGVGTVIQYDATGNPLTAFGGPDPAHFSYPGLQGATALAVDELTHDVYVSRPGKIDVFTRDPAPVTVPTVSTSSPDSLQGASATLTGSVDGDGIDTVECAFEWGKTIAYGNSAGCSEGDVFAGGSGGHPVSAPIGGLVKGTTYHYRLVAKNANEVTALGRDIQFRAADPPVLGDATVDRVTTDSARVRFDVNPNGGSTSYRVEVGTDTDYGRSFPVPDATPEGLTRSGSILTTQGQTQELSGLEADTEYHYRVVASNPAGETTGGDHVFRTFRPPSTETDTCANAHARQQTGAATLPDCRAYELVSAADTGGYDVRSDLDGQAPLAAYPGAEDRALYSMRSGTIPGIAGDPTNRGADPYVATRGPSGWSTTYVGLPASDPFADTPFASPLLGADAGLNTFAFGGDDICSPCFEDGSTNVPLRLAGGALVKGMAGSLEPGPAEAAGAVSAPFSADGSHFVFGATAQLEPAANSNGADVTIYDRDLEIGTTQVVSTLPGGETIQAGAGVAELGISADGSRLVIGQLVATDSTGNHYYHLYMHVGSSSNTVDLTPGATGGALYNGMSADGSRVYFTTKDALATVADQDTDTSADLYRAEVDGGAATVTRVSTGAEGTGNTDSCDPPPNSFGVHWNVVGGSATCGVAAAAGGGGVASIEGGIFFLSPERLDGSIGVQDEPNLYYARPGQGPRFVATLESKSTGPNPPPTQHPFTMSFGAFNLPQSMAVDQSTGNVYVLDVTAGSVKRFDAEGTPANFSTGPNAGGNALTGFKFVGGNATGQVAVDNSGGPTDGDVYVTNNSSTEPTVKIFARSGASLGQLSGTSTPEAQFGAGAGLVKYPSGVATAPDGTLYVSGGASGKVYRYSPSANPVAETDYQATLNFGDASNVPGPLAADSTGALYVNKLNGSGLLASGAGLSKYSAAQLGQPGTQAGQSIDTAATASYVDPRSDHLYVTRATTIAEYTPSGALQIVFGAGQLSNSKGIAVLGSADATTSTIFASNSGVAKNVSVFATLPAPSALVDNPLATHAVNSSGSRHSEDLQVTPGGETAVFTSTLPLTGFVSARHSEIFRYDIAGGELACVSCPSTAVAPSGDTTLSPYGLNLADDGRVFFTSPDPLALGDANERLDAYEWEDGTQALISTGTSATDSSLASVSSDGGNAFFFTRQQLAPEDHNASRVRLYTAREGGGFAFGPPSSQCAASDECHGPGTQVAPAASIGTLAGTPGQAEPVSKCRKGSVRRRGRCSKRRSHKRRAHKRTARAAQGAAK